MFSGTYTKPPTPNSHSLSPEFTLQNHNSSGVLGKQAKPMWLFMALYMCTTKIITSLLNSPSLQLKEEREPLRHVLVCACMIHLPRCMWCDSVFVQTEES